MLGLGRLCFPDQGHHLRGVGNRFKLRRHRPAAALPGLKTGKGHEWLLAAAEGKGPSIIPAHGKVDLWQGSQFQGFQIALKQA